MNPIDDIKKGPELHPTPYSHALADEGKLPEGVTDRTSQFHRMPRGFLSAENRKIIEAFSAFQSHRTLSDAENAALALQCNNKVVIYNREGKIVKCVLPKDTPDKEWKKITNVIHQYCTNLVISEPVPPPSASYYANHARENISGHPQDDDHDIFYSDEGENEAEEESSISAITTYRWTTFSQKPPAGIVDYTEEIINLYGLKRLKEAMWCVGRKNDLKQMLPFLGTKESPPNVLLTGSSGVGKTTLVFELARLLVTRDALVPTYLQGYHVYDVATNFTDLKALEVFATAIGGKGIFVFDECHSKFEQKMMSQEGHTTNFGQEVKKFMKPKQPGSFLFLSNTPPYRFTEDAALVRRHFTHILKELSYETSLQLMLGKRAELCQQWSSACGKSISIEEDVLELAIKLSMAFLPQELLPGKIYRILEPATLGYVDKYRHKSSVTMTKEALIAYVRKQFDVTDEHIEEKLAEIEAKLLVSIPTNEMLIHCTRNLTLEARQGKLNEAWGCRELIDQIVIRLGAKNGRNVFLKGPPGAGKSSIAYGLAYLMAKGEYPQLADKQLLLLDHNHLTAVGGGARDFMHSALKYKDKYILVIDEVHRLNGKKETPLTLEDFLIPWAEGKIPTILITTDEESKPLLNNEAIVRRVTVMQIKPLPLAETHQLLKERVNHYILSTQTINPDALKAVVYLSQVYLSEESQPAAAIKMLSHLSSYAHHRGIKEIDRDSVMQAISYFQRCSIESVEEKLAQEIAGDHPLTQVIAQGSPLKLFCEDLTREALLHRLPHYTFSPSRKELFDKMCTILQKPHCNNVILEAEPGSGKTALVKELARRIAFNEVPLPLQNKVLLSLKALAAVFVDDMRFIDFTKQVQSESGKFILFVDEWHTIVPYLDKLLPLLSDGHLRMIGATSHSFHKLVEHNPALLARFTHLRLPPLEFNEALEILKASRPSLQAACQKSLMLDSVTFTDEMLEKALVTSSRANWPRSAIDCLQTEAAWQASCAREANAALTAIHIQRLSNATPKAALEPQRVSYISGFLHSLQRAVMWVAYPLFKVTHFFYQRLRRRIINKPFA